MTTTITRGARWVSYILQGLICAMLLMGAVSNIAQTSSAVDGAVLFGYPESSVLYLGIVLLLSTVLYIIPKTTIFGAALITAWLGGAVATHVIHADPTFNIMFPAIIGVVVWFCLWLRYDKVRQIVF